MNPFLNKENAGGGNEVTRTTLAPSNPPKSYAKGGSEMLKKLLSISENTRRRLAEPPAALVSNTEKVEGSREDARNDTTEAAQERKTEYEHSKEKKKVVAVSLLGRPPKQTRELEVQTFAEEVIDLVSDDDEVGSVNANVSQCQRSTSQTGIALFDVFDDDDGGDEGYYDDDDDEYYEDDGEQPQQNPAASSLRESLYGLPAEIEGQEWWRRMPDFQPISSIVQRGNHDVRGGLVHVDFLAQFKGTRISSPRGASGTRRKPSKAGHWETRDGTRTYVSATGTAMTGVQAYREYEKSKSGTKRKTGTKKRRKNSSSKKRRSSR